MIVRKIVATGGGSLQQGETLPIDKEVVDLTGKERPHVAFMPTASFDTPGYAEDAARVYSGLGCTLQPLFLWEGYTPEEIETTIQKTKWNEEPHVWEFRGNLNQVEETLESADIVYVGGGNTRRMIELWRSIGVDKMIDEASQRGAVLTGVSAGCICWARYGNSDAALTEGLGTNTMRIDCLNYLPISLCPHTSREGFRLGEFAAMVATTPGVGIGLDDGCALEVVGDQYRFLSCLPGAHAHRIYSNWGQVVTEDLQVIGEWASFEKLCTLQG